jgi:hypothetical protein
MLKMEFLMAHEGIMEKALLRAFARTILLLLVLCFSIHAATAQSKTPEPQPSPKASPEEPKEDPRDPVERSDEFKSKLTFGVYFTPHGQAYDLNLRHQFGQHVTAWIAGFHDSDGSKLIRIGGQYDYRKGWFHFVPTGEIETTKGASLSLSSEFGRDTVAIVGYSRTNLKTFFDLFWDPGDSVQLGVGHKISSYDRIQAYTIFDVRLHTGQQNTHIVWRHKLNRNNGITFDGVFKSGHLDSGEYIRAVGIGVYYDREKWFWKLYYDPHVNFSDPTMVRTGIGLKF